MKKEIEDVKVSIEWVDPDTASKWFSNRRPNRPFMQTHADKFLSDMINDRWPFDGSPVKFVEDCLSDGQHRMDALRRSGLTLPFVIIRGLTPASEHTNDTGRNRTLRDVLSMEKEAYAGVLAACLSYVARFRRDGRFNVRNAGPTREETRLLLEPNPFLRTCAAAYAHPGPQLPVSRAIMSALYFLFWEKHPGLAERFMNEIDEGRMLEEGDPAHTLRRYAIAQSRLGKRQSFATDFGHYAIQAWNYRVNNEKLYKLVPQLPPYVIGSGKGHEVAEQVDFLKKARIRKGN